MLIKSECQPLDKTRHKPAWSLFEQCEPCKMAREICRAAWPLNSAHTQPCYHHFCWHVQRRRQTHVQKEGDVEESAEAHLLCSLRVTSARVNTRLWWDDRRPPSLTCGWCLHQISLTIRAGGETYVRAEITVPVIRGEQRLREQTHHMRNHQWQIRAKNAEGWPVGGDAQ